MLFTPLKAVTQVMRTVASVLLLVLAAIVPSTLAALTLGQSYPAGALEVNVSDPVRLPIYPSYPAYQNLRLIVRRRAKNYSSFDFVKINLKLFQLRIT